MIGYCIENKVGQVEIVSVTWEKGIFELLLYNGLHSFIQQIASQN